MSCNCSNFWESLRQAQEHAKEAIKHRKCALCKCTALDFKDELSRREYFISGLCQECQDKIFVQDE